ncbi:MAG TPA: NERD domain-containing protein, partial [Methylomicrobium sp.]|nr:NERD domain-containing protein [Methylomicrobium sp.]
QVDALVVTRTTVCLVEVKGYSSPVRGGCNGPWEMLKPRDGQFVWEKMTGPNGYAETLSHKMALSDEMHQFAREVLSNAREHKDKFFKLFHACLCFVPDIPEDSHLPESDYKVVTCGYLSSFKTLLDQHLKPSWSFEQWEHFAGWLGLEPVSSEALLEGVAGSKPNPLSEYQRSFSYHQRYHWIPTEVLNQGKPTGRQAIKDCLSGGQSCVIRGPSGMGKSCLARDIVAEIGRADSLVIKCNARYFHGDIESMLKDSVERYGGWTLEQLLSRAHAVGIPPVVFLDGWNECNTGIREQLAQQLDLQVNRRGATLFLTSQFSPIEICTPLKTFDLAPLKETDKFAIANLDDASEPKLACLLRTVSSGMDARIVGEISEQVQGNASRAELFDAFVRKRLAECGHIASTLFDAMVIAATAMHDNLANSLAMSQLHLLMTSLKDGTAALDSLEHTGLVAVDWCRRNASFAHEQYQHFFAAWGLLRECGAANDLIALLEMPRHMEVRTFLLGLYGVGRIAYDLAEIVWGLKTSDTLY